MDKIDDRYKNGKIYEITSNNTDMVYVGSCYTPLNRRLTIHKSKKNCSSKYIIECGDYNINLIEEYSCNNNTELRIREQYWIDKYKREDKNIINEINAYLSKEQRLESKKDYREKNREKISEYNKEYGKKYREKNKERKRESDKKYRENNREKFNEYSREYYSNNREKAKTHSREYYANNREKYNEYKKEFRFMNKKIYVNACYEFLEMLKHY